MAVMIGIRASQPGDPRPVGMRAYCRQPSMEVGRMSISWKSAEVWFGMKEREESVGIEGK